MLAFFVFINLVFLLAIGADAPQIVFVVVRVFGGTCIALTNHIIKGFSLYEDLAPEDFKAGRDSEALYFMRLIFLGVLVVFTIYLLISCCCLCCLGGIDGNNLRYNAGGRNPNKLFKRVPFGNLVFQEGLDCPICMESFSDS